ncbi:MAG: adenosylcobinamide-GDP ribazoletransferase [Desulfotomaculaceae bacterium]|nr:adenosylcobinamide-GDP ribazoletransferase [Desulfotomaculaceae bacterium]
MKSFLLAFYQLTRLPLPNVNFDEKACGRATLFFPAVGLFLGGLLAALAWAAGYLFPSGVKASLLVVGMVVLTGGMHLDGFMDSIDGLFSGRARERKLEIMRDSRVGAFGVIGVICLLLLKYNLLLELPDGVLLKVLLILPVLSRWGMAIAVIAFPYARPDGLGKVYAIQSGSKELAGSTIITAVAATLILGLQGAWLVALAASIAWLVGRKIVKELGGLTGDTYGLINELLEVALLFAVYPILRWSYGFHSILQLPICRHFVSIMKGVM